MTELVTLRDGAEILIRPIAPDDASALSSGFEALSAASRYRRFLSPTNRLDSKWLAYLTNVDHHNHEALVAEARETHEPVGVARYIRLTNVPETAEVAMAVVDHWQNRGVASELLARLVARARAEGVARFHATCLADNRARSMSFRRSGRFPSAAWARG